MLKINDFTTGYGKVEIVHDISMEVPRDKIVSIIGKNGVGKSTLIKGIMGLLPSKGGEILFNDKDITNEKTYNRARDGIAYSPQGHNLFPNLTVEENLKMGESINIKNLERNYDAVFSFFPRIKERLNQKAGTLSGGERAQVSIGRALIGRPLLLILDEPSEGIQPNIIDTMGDIILQINKELNLTVLLVEQHMGLIKKLTDTCYAIDKGKVVGTHSKEEINDQTLQKYLSI